MKILHLDLKRVGNDYAELRYFWDNPNAYQSRQLPIAEISDLIERSETDYYTRLPEDYAKTGQALYHWLDGSARILQHAINEHRREGIVLAIATSERLAHLPWEVLHDGNSFLVQRRPAIIPVRWMADEKQLTQEDESQNRALNVLYMAASPLGVEPELDFEAEEGRILEETKRFPLSLIVEESGWLNELGYLVKTREPGYFDVVHLTGHATFRDEKPYFITETEFGEPEYSSAEDIADVLQFKLPKLIFLSGCSTGYSMDEGTVRSMAEALLAQGATAVLSWGQKVLDTNAIAAAATLYQELSAGSTVTEAVAKTYQALIKSQARDWHLLRLYVASTLPGALVTPLVTPKRQAAPRPSTASEFLDSEGHVRVANRESFVSRRRQLQNCLRFLKTSQEEMGVLIHGMGGLGKSAIALRLCDRLSDHEKMVWWRQIDESNLVSKLADKLIKPDLKELREKLQDSNEEIKFKLANLFGELNERGEKPFLLVLDDFEWNLEHRQGKYILKPEAARVLAALVWAIKKTNTDHRIIITCRYDFNSELLQSFYKQPLEAFRKSDLQKKLNRLDKFHSETLDKNLVDRALQLADGNPRLLEWLNDEVLSSSEAEKKLAQLEASPQDWKEKIIWSELYEQIDRPIEKLLSRCLVFEIPIPMSALEAVCEPISGYKEQLSRAIELGLIEVSPQLKVSERVYRVSRILPHIVPDIQLPEEPEVYSLYQKAHEKLHQLWGNQENKSEEQWREIFRLLFANRENIERFRQGFSQMLEVQNNREADKVYEFELRKVADDLVEDGLCTLLENYLKQGKWKEADEETAWIFYQVLVKENFENWDKLLENFPCETLKEINRLWLQNSNSKFGISIQMEIYQSLGGTKEYNMEPEIKVKQMKNNLEVWRKFGDCVGWEGDRKWNYKAIMNQVSAAPPDSSPAFLPSLPLLIYTREFEGMPQSDEGFPGRRWGWLLDVDGGLVQWSSHPHSQKLRLFSRVESCNL